MRIYNNPIILQDFSDPDAIRVGEDFYMIASSFNHMPGVPILHSKNLVDWELINYVYDSFPLAKYDKVCPGHGAWAPSLRYHNNTFYAMIPTPDEGLFVASTKDIYGKWEKPWCLKKGKGLEDPCPIWLNGKAYVVHGFVKSRCGFNSKLAIFEATEDLKETLTDSVVIYDGHNNNPTIEGPKFNYRNGFYYILAPAGGVTTGWQTCLRSKNIYGPYETKIVLTQGHTNVNGPHQGALIDIDDNDNWAFIHFQDQECYGRVCHLQPVTWLNDWPVMGRVSDPLLAGEPVLWHEYLIDKGPFYKLELSDKFKDKLGLQWQTLANPKKDWYYLEDGLNLKALNPDIKKLGMLPNFYGQKLGFKNFTAETELDLTRLEENSKFGFSYLGLTYYGLYVTKENDINYLCLFENGEEKDTVLSKMPYNEDRIKLKLRFYEPNCYQLGYNNVWFKDKFIATKGAWVGGKIGIFAWGANGYAKFKYFKVKENKNARKG